LTIAAACWVNCPYLTAAHTYLVRTADSLFTLQVCLGRAQNAARSACAEAAYGKSLDLMAMQRDIKDVWEREHPQLRHAHCSSQATERALFFKCIPLSVTSE